MASLWKSFLEAPGYLEKSPWFPNPAIAARDIISPGVKEVYERLPWNGLVTWLTEVVYAIFECHNTDHAFTLYAVIIAILLTLLRVFLNRSVFKPISKWYQLTSDSAAKFPESIWKFMFYSVSSSISIYLVVMDDKNMFFYIQHHWDGYSCDAKVEPGLFFLYVLEMGFYLHSIYAITYMDTIRKDYCVMMLHHVLAILHLAYSYVVKFHLLGLMLISFLDIGDVFMELSKVFHYFKDCGNKKHPIIETLCNTCFGLFTIQYVILRIYWYPTKLVYSAMYASATLVSGRTFDLFYNPMVLGFVLLYAMQVYWFKYILRLLWKIFILGDELSDNRDYEERPKKVKIDEMKKEE